MRVHWLQHAEHEGLGCIGPWLDAKGYSITRTRLYAGEALPDATKFDWLVVMGGPMNIYEHDVHPWLILEKELINDAIVTNKKVLGICLGSQLIADVLGGPVNRNDHVEIGWFDVYLTENRYKSDITNTFPDRFKAFHWHGDTYALPPGSRNHFKSDACVNQFFSWGARVLGLQFHLEVTHADARVWLKQEELRPDRYVQSAVEILREPSRFEMNNRLMVKLLEWMDSIR